jgi:hypothetical protein
VKYFKEADVCTAREAALAEGIDPDLVARMGPTISEMRVARKSWTPSNVSCSGTVVRAFGPVSRPNSSGDMFYLQQTIYLSAHTVGEYNTVELHWVVGC